MFKNGCNPNEQDLYGNYPILFRHLNGQKKENGRSKRNINK